MNDGGIRDFFRSPVRPDKLGARQASYSMDTLGSLCGVKRSDREADHLHPYNAEFNNAESVLHFLTCLSDLCRDSFWLVYFNNSH